MVRESGRIEHLVGTLNSLRYVYWEESKHNTVLSHILWEHIQQTRVDLALEILKSKRKRTGRI